MTLRACGVLSGKVTLSPSSPITQLFSGIGLGLFGLALIATLLVTGLLLIRIGFRSRRRGSTPRCRTCEYDLTGLVSDRCPECGTVITTESEVYGERYRRPVLGLIGLLLIVLATLPLLKPVQQINWYQYVPTGVVLNHLETTTGPALQKTWTEIQRRDKAGQLSKRHLHRLIEICLKEQASSSPRKMQQTFINYLGQLYLDSTRSQQQNALSQEQADRFFSQMVTLEFETRPRVVRGDSVPYRIKHWGHGPVRSFYSKQEMLAIAVDDSEVQRNGGATGGGVSGHGAMSSVFEYDVPGTHTVRVDLRLRIYDDTVGTREEDRVLLYEEERSLKAEFELLDEEPEGYIQMVENPTLKQQLQNCITLERFAFRGRPNKLHAHMEFKKVPVNVAFEVLASIGGKEYHFSALDVSQGRSIQWSVISDADIPPAESCTVIFRSSEKRARATVDLFEIWDGELVYENVPIKLPQATTTSTAPVN